MGTYYTTYFQGEELGPLEIQINSLQKSIDAEQSYIIELQQMWLRDQSELVRLMQEKDTQVIDVSNLKKQFTILFQKKLRIERKYCNLITVQLCNFETGQDKHINSVPGGLVISEQTSQ